MLATSFPFNNRPPCERLDECRIIAGPQMSKTVYYPPVYNGYGNNINLDKNRTIQNMRCETCFAEWTETYANS